MQDVRSARRHIATRRSTLLACGVDGDKVAPEVLSCRCTRKVVIDDAGVHRKIRIDQPRSRYVPQRIYMHIPQITGTVRVWTGLIGE